VNNTVGIAGSASSAELLIAKVLDTDDLIDVEAEVKAIRWAVLQGFPRSEERWIRVG
jgi:hypothetical protein